MVELHSFLLHVCILFASFLISERFAIAGEIFLTVPLAYGPVTWVNTPSTYPNTSYTLSPLLQRQLDGPQFLCSFYCNTTDSTTCFLGIFTFQFWFHDENGTGAGIWFNQPQLIWTANRDKPVRANATLQLRQNGDLVLSDSDGLLVWTSKTNGKSVSGLNLTELGSLVLFGENNETIWQSFDYPTDSLVIGQKMLPGQSLRASVSASDLSQGLYVLTFGAQNLSAFVDSNPPQRFAYGSVQDRNLVDFYNGSFTRAQIPFSSAYTQFMRFEPDGHFKVYEWKLPGQKWSLVVDILQVVGGECGYPLVCGNYGVCSEGQCFCPNVNASQRSFFRENNPRLPNLGCSLVNPITCGDSRYHSLVELKDSYYFAFNSSLYDEKIELESCKANCLKDCSCRAALFLYNGSSSGGCMLLNEVFSIAENKHSKVSTDNTSLFIKVQDSPLEMRIQRRSKVKAASAVGASVGAFIILLCCIVVIVRKRLCKAKDVKDDDFEDILLGTPNRYSYEELKAATENFSIKLGKGGFGSVYKGILSNGTEIAVKCLDNLDKGNESFLAEVRTIGSVHHFNLVKLIGFCTDKYHRILVYDYMPNGSLERWIFGEERGVSSLQWDQRKKIIADIAKGLAYLHEECSQKIIHLDIKPQNILLDKDLNAKVSDFGLSKLIEKDQSRTVTKMRGTPGYLAPEWLSSAITEKVDVYSFGIVTLEIICGRKNLDWSLSEEEAHLVSLYAEKVKEEQGLWELVDKSCEDIEIHKEEVINMMKIGAWCLQTDFTKRPSMSLVVKVLQGLLPAETNLDYDLMNLPAFRGVAISAFGRVDQNSDANEISTPMLPSLLSAPR